MSLSAKPFWTLSESRYFTKSTATSGASCETAHASPPPSASVGSPEPPSTAGNGNQPVLSPSPLPSSVRPCMTPGSQWPCSSIATLPVASRPDAEVAPSCALVVRKPALNGLVFNRSSTTSPAFSKHGSEKSRLVIASLSTSSGQARNAVLYQ